MSEDYTVRIDLSHEDLLEAQAQMRKRVAELLDRMGPEPRSVREDSCICVREYFPGTNTLRYYKHLDTCPSCPKK
jgi:hypothetical protein